MSDNNLGLYIHIPFCVKKCNYCDFNSGSFSDDIKEKYVESLCNEIKIKSEDFSDRTVDTIFFGGGTPSILKPELLGKIFDCLRCCFNIKDDSEITIESNPGTLDKEKIKAYKNFGINRLSIGLQSFNDNELKILGRIHNEKDFMDSFMNAREEGFDNINVDLMSAVPLQTLLSFESNLNKISLISPEHVSIYSLIVEENTPFYSMNLDLPDEEDERRMIHMIPEILTDYSQYEISNYCKHGYECRHNIKYWKRDEYLGFGVSAASFIKNEQEIRYKNTSDINKYIGFFSGCGANDIKVDVSNENKETDISSDRISKNKKTKILKEDFNTEGINRNSIYEEYEILDEKEIISEYIILGLRMNEGISLEAFLNIFGQSIFDIYDKEISKHKNNGLLTIENGNLRLTEKGRDVGNYVWSDFI